MANPIPTHAEWKAEKVKYGIPDRVLKTGGFGAKVEALNKQFAKSSLDKPIASKAATAKIVLEATHKLYKEWLDGAGKLPDTAFKNGKPSKDGAVNRKKAIELVERLDSMITMFEQRYASLKDPFLSARAGGWTKCVNFMKAAQQHPEDQQNLERLWGQGIRNDLGMSFRAALTTYKGDPEVEKMLKQYDEGAAAYAQIISNAKDGGARGIAEDPARRKKFLADMMTLMKLGEQILEATKP